MRVKLLMSKNLYELMESLVSCQKVSFNQLDFLNPSKRVRYFIEDLSTNQLAKTHFLVMRTKKTGMKIVQQT